jgi:hypothetical protein
MSSSGTTDAKSRVKAWLATPRAVPWIVGVAMLLTASSLSAGLAADDFLHAVVLAKLPLPRPMSGPFDLFRFASGDTKNAHDLMNLGQFPWTADPTTRFAFFRPLSAATHVLDYALWPHSPALMHAQNMAWFAVAILSVCAVYRRFLGQSWVAGLALLLFALDDTHGPTVGWIANRNSIVALAVGLPVLVLHDRWRKEGWRPGVWAAPLLLFTGLFAGESALAVAAYLASYALYLDAGSWRTRAASLAPYGVVLALWRAVYTTLGYGVSGSGLYLDPGHQPAAFLAAVPRRLPFLLLGQLALPRSDLGQTYEFVAPRGLEWMMAYAVLMLVLLALAMRRTWQKDPTVRFFALGMLLSAIPVCAAFISDRLLIFVGVGAMALVAKLVESAASFGERLASAFLLFVHVVIAPPMLALRSHINDYQLWIDAADKTIPKGPDVTSKTVVIIDPPNDLFFCYTPAVRAVRGENMPARIRGLADVVTAVDVARVDERTLRVHPDGGYLAHEPERMLRSEVRAMPVGSTVELDGMKVTIASLTADGRPDEALFRFDAPLEDPSFVWLQWTKEGFAPWVPPAVGERTRVPAHDVRRAVLDIEDALTERRR